MAKAFWFTLLIAYLTGAFALAIYLSPAVVEPSIANLALFAGFSTAFVAMVTARLWQGRGDRTKTGCSLNLLRERLAHLIAPGPARHEELALEPRMRAMTEEEAIAGEHSAEAQVGIEDGLPAGRFPDGEQRVEEMSVQRRSRVHVEPETDREQGRLPRLAAMPDAPDHLFPHLLNDENAVESLAVPASGPGINAEPAAHRRTVPVRHEQGRGRPDDVAICCEAMPVVALPPRRAVGWQIIGHLQEGGAQRSRQSLLAHGIAAEVMARFDRALLEQVRNWLGAPMTPLPADLPDGRLIVDLSLQALRSRQCRNVLQHVIGEAERHGFTMLLAIGTGPGEALPRIDASKLGPGTQLFWRASSPDIDPRSVLAAGFAGIAMEHAVVQRFLGLPLNQDPLFGYLNRLDAAGGQLMVDGIGNGTQLRDILDYPCGLGAGQAFGEPMALDAAGQPEPELPRAAAARPRIAIDIGDDVDEGLEPFAGSGAPAPSVAHLRGRMGYGTAR